MNDKSELEYGEVPLQEVLGDDDVDMKANSNQSFSLYRSAFALEYDACTDLTTLNIVVAYNLAVIHHELALANSDEENTAASSYSHLMMARSFYLMALSHVNQHKRQHEKGQRTCPLVIELALRNNLGHLSCELGDAQALLDCQAALENCLSRCCCAPTPSPSSSSLNHEAIAFFQMSVIRSRQYALALAPAA